LILSSGSFNCFFQFIQVPATVDTLVSMICDSPLRAASNALRCLNAIVRMKAVRQGTTHRPCQRCVVKLGYSWHAERVWLAESAADLARILATFVQPLVERSDNVQRVFVQEYVDAVVELRLYVAAGRVHHRIFTKFGSSTDANSQFHDLEWDMERQAVLTGCFHSNAAALHSCEVECEELARRWYSWLHAHSDGFEAVSAIRMDFLLGYHPDTSTHTVQIGELTELGFCMNGWDEGPVTVNSAILAACVGESADDGDGAGGDGGDTEISDYLDGMAETIGLNSSTSTEMDAARVVSSLTGDPGGDGDSRARSMFQKAFGVFQASHAHRKSSGLLPPQARSLWTSAVLTARATAAAADAGEIVVLDSGECYCMCHEDGTEEHCTECGGTRVFVNPVYHFFFLNACLAVVI
jgi:hypothetical protein